MKTLVDTVEEPEDDGFETRTEYRWRCPKCGKPTKWNTKFRVETEKLFHKCRDIDLNLAKRRKEKPRGRYR